MKGFKLLRLLGPPGDAMRERYVVTMMGGFHARRGGGGTRVLEGAAAAR